MTSTIDPQAPRLQVVVAHPDDETFGCGGLLLHARASAFATFVTCATRGEAGEDRGGRQGPELAEVRADELRRAGELLGVSEVELLGFADSGMTGPAPDGSLAGADMTEVVAAVRDALRRVRPDVVLTLDASDGHRDHQRIREATMLATAEVGVEVVYISCLPQSLMRQWVERMLTDSPDKEHVRDHEPVLGTPDDEISTVIDVRKHRAQIESAIAAHASQESPFDGLPEDLRDAFLDTARARRVVPDWDGNACEHLLARRPRRDELMTSTTARDTSSLASLERRRHRHENRCWWNHLEARWNCTSTISPCLPR